jgi:hypothetical protein
MSNTTILVPRTQVTERAVTEPTQRALPAVATAPPARKTALDVYQSLWRFPTSTRNAASAAART